MSALMKAQSQITLALFQPYELRDIGRGYFDVLGTRVDWIEVFCRHVLSVFVVHLSFAARHELTRRH